MQLLYKKGSYHISYTSQYYCRSQTFLWLMLTFTIFIISIIIYYFFVKRVLVPKSKRSHAQRTMNGDEATIHNSKSQISIPLSSLVDCYRLLKTVRHPLPLFINHTHQVCKMAWHNMQTVIKYQTEKDIATVTPKRE